MRIGKAEFLASIDFFLWKGKTGKVALAKVVLLFLEDVLSALQASLGIVKVKGIAIEIVQKGGELLLEKRIETLIDGRQESVGGILAKTTHPVLKVIEAETI